ncbi:hypothetical protein R6Q59_030779 [Mikania micrantha]
MTMVPVVSSSGSEDIQQVSIKQLPQHVHNAHSDPNLREDSPGSIMRIVPSDADVILVPGIEWDGVDLLSEEFGLAEVGTPRSTTLSSDTVMHT